MSHFVVIVVGDNVEEQLIPYTEFESSGIEGSHVVEKDITDDMRREWQESDADTVSFTEWVADYEEIPLIRESEKPDIADVHKYGYAVIDENKEIVKVIARTNPNGKWDWYTIGGRWNGYFTRYDGSRVNAAMVKDIDFAAMLKRSLDRELELYSRVHEILRRYPPVKTFDELLAENNNNADEARSQYWAQPAIVEINKNDTIFPLIHDQYLTNSLPEFVNNVMYRTVVPFAIVKDGEWHEKGEMGWFGTHTPHITDKEWAEYVTNMLLSLPGDTMLTVIDCHC